MIYKKYHTYIKTIICETSDHNYFVHTVGVTCDRESDLCYRVAYIVKQQQVKSLTVKQGLPEHSFIQVTENLIIIQHSNTIAKRRTNNDFNNNYKFK